MSLKSIFGVIATTALAVVALAVMAIPVLGSLLATVAASPDALDNQDDGFAFASMGAALLLSLGLTFVEAGCLFGGHIPIGVVVLKCCGTAAQAAFVFHTPMGRPVRRLLKGAVATNPVAA